ncbi:hypothetical protein YC2023_114010 [Brassica napus]
MGTKRHFNEQFICSKTREPPPPPPPPPYLVSVKQRVTLKIKTMDMDQMQPNINKRIIMEEDSKGIKFQNVTRSTEKKSKEAKTGPHKKLNIFGRKNQTWKQDNKSRRQELREFPSETLVFLNLFIFFLFLNHLLCSLEDKLSSSS